MNKLKGIILVVSICFASIMMPFTIYAAGETQIVPTYTSSTTQQEWQTKIRVTNYCEGTNASTASCKLSFYVTGNYYGVINVDGYDSSNTHWLNGTYIYVADGYGEYNYNFYQNGIKEITKISIWGVQLFQPDSNVDLTQIIQLLTSINSYNQLIEGNQDTQITQLQTVINDLVIANGYLEALTKIRQFNIPFESFSFNYYLLNNYSTFTKEYFDKYVYLSSYPVFNTVLNKPIYKTFLNSNPNNFNHTQTFILVTDLNVSGANQIPIQFDIDTSKYNVSNYQYLNYYNGYFLVRFDITASVTGDFELIPTVANRKVIGIFANYTKFNNQVSTDFALKYGLTNQLLDDLHTITNGNTASNNASQQLESDTSDFNTDRDDLIDIEDSMGNNMDSAMNQITPNNNGLSGFGGNFLTSAVWVRTQFEILTNNTPYGSLIVYGMTLGLALLLLGKVML